MKEFKLLTVFYFIAFYANAQQTITKNLTHDGIEREYILYIPDSYNNDSKTPLLFNFHGYTSNANEQMIYGDFREIADQKGFILVHPEGELFNGQTHWNVGGWTIGSNIDDVGFVEKMIEELSLDYNIDLDRVYSTGMSNGGFMSFLLACQLSDKIAAIASVTGSMTPSTYNECNPNHQTPVLYIHGTNDGTVPYGGATWTKKVEDVLDYWKLENKCDNEPFIEAMPDLDTTDGSTVEIISYLNGESEAEVVHYKVIGGDHTWPGTALNFPGTNQDFNASEVIWEFLSRYDINGIINVETSDYQIVKNDDVRVFPNPASTLLNVVFSSQPDLNYKLINIEGNILKKGTFTHKEEQIDVSKLSTGSYILKVGGQSYKVVITK